MKREEFSNQFDVLLNSFNSNAPTDIRLDEYEKGVFLTQSQEEEVLSLYNGKNAAGEGFEETEEIRRYLANLVCEAELKPIDNTSGKPIGMEGTNSYFFSLPDGKEGEPALWFITYEGVIISDGKCEDTSSLQVVPVRQDEYHKLRKNPFRGANDRRALRLDLSEGNVEIISKYGVTTYYVRYLRKLNPIVLTDFSKDDVCELPDILHRRILERAVMLALKVKGVKIENNENR